MNVWFILFGGAKQIKKPLNYVLIDTLHCCRSLNKRRNDEVFGPGNTLLRERKGESPVGPYVHKAHISKSDLGRRSVWETLIITVVILFFSLFVRERKRILLGGR